LVLSLKKTFCQVVLEGLARIERLSKGGANEKTTGEPTDVDGAQLKWSNDTNGCSSLWGVQTLKMVSLRGSERYIGFHEDFVLTWQVLKWDILHAKWQS